MFNDRPSTLDGVSSHGGSHVSHLSSGHAGDARKDLAELREFVNDGWLQYGGLDGPVFLWNRMISEVSVQDDHSRSNSPVAPLEQARAMMMTPIEWYLRAIGSTTASATPTAGGYDIPRVDMPTFRIESHALSGVEAVVGNATMSTQWIPAARNLALAATITSMFIGTVADRNDEGYEFLKGVIQNIRLYADAIARNAEPSTAQTALGAIVGAACSDNFKLNPLHMVELLSSCLSFAQWDDTRVLAYDAISRGERAMLDTAEVTGFEDPDDADESIKAQLFEQFEHSMLFLHHDLLRVSGEDAEADAYLREHHDVEALADAYAVRLISQNRWRELLDFSSTVVDDNPNQHVSMIPASLVPYEWDSIREMALLALDERDKLCALYRERIVEAYGHDEVYNVTRLRAVSRSTWGQQVRAIIREYDDGRGRFTRNLAYEQILMMEKLGIHAWRYCLQFPRARARLAKTISLVRPDRARGIVLGKLHLDGTYEGDLPSDSTLYEHIAEVLDQYAAIFGASQARQVANRLMEHYPRRYKLARALHHYLPQP